MSEPKFCKDCKHAHVTLGLKILMPRSKYLYAKCLLFPKDNRGNYLATGKIDPDEFNYCSIIRMYNTNPCGVDGKLWEKK